MQRLPVAILLAAVPLSAQQTDNPAAAAEMPNPVHKEHELLKGLAGYWNVVFQSEAMPGVPGMEKATECRGTEHAELVCNGLFLKSVTDYTWQGKPVQALWLAGYDPFAKHYTGIYVSSDVEQCGVSTMTGSYDDKTRTWAWSVPTPQGEMRSTFAFTDKDTTVETCFMVGKDGAETKCMEITRRRARPWVARDASAVTPSDLLKEQAAMLRDVGDWNATMQMTMAAGGEPIKEKATETVRSICHGRWTWTDYNGQMMGQPFEGHALTGYDPAKKEYVSFWIDSLESLAMETRGTMAADGRSCNFKGTAFDGKGQPMPVVQQLHWQDDGSRTLTLDFGSGEQSSHLRIDYSKRAKN